MITNRETVSFSLAVFQVACAQNSETSFANWINRLAYWLIKTGVSLLIMHNEFTSVFDQIHKKQQETVFAFCR